MPERMFPSQIPGRILSFKIEFAKDQEIMYRGADAEEKRERLIKAWKKSKNRNI